MKKFQHEKSKQKVNHRNIATRKKVQHEKSASRKTFMMKTL